MKRDRVIQVVLVVVGLLYLAWAVPLFQALWHSSWIQEKLEDKTMFVSVNTVLGIFLLLAVSSPARYRMLIAFGAWSSLAHAATMAIQTIEARAQGIPRSPLDVVVIGSAALLLFAVLAAIRDAGPSSVRPTPVAKAP